jgi:predicted phosphodiesterase
MLIRVLSDLHLEFEGPHTKLPFEVNSLDTDKDTVLVLAGDIHYGYRVKDFIDPLKDRFKAIVYVAGNHEFWGENSDEVRKYIREEIHGNNVYFLDNSYVEIEDTLFIGGTLWTDFRNGDPLVMVNASFYMMDYRKIVTGEDHRILTPGYLYMEHKITKSFIFDSLIESSCKKKIVVTHHAPSFQSVGPMYVGSTSNDYFASHLEGDILANCIDLWIHGHMHDPCDYNIGDTRVICNPKGYGSAKLALGFRPNLLIKT